MVEILVEVVEVMEGEEVDKETSCAAVTQSHDCITLSRMSLTRLELVTAKVRATSVASQTHCIQKHSLSHSGDAGQTDV
jgi:hypothetical protein